MKKELLKLQPLLLRPFETLTGDEVSYLVNGYEKYGREAFEEWLKREKQTRCYASLVLSQLDIADKEYWKEAHQEYTTRNESILELLKPIFEDFHSHQGRSLCVYENFGAVLSSGESLGCFASGDVDLVVNDAGEELALQCLERAGFKRDTRKDHATVSERLCIPLYNPDVLDGKGYWINLMRQPVSRNFMLVQGKYKERLNEECYLNTPYKDTAVMLLNPTALVYFNALHFACEHHYSASPGMALCCDVDRVVRAKHIEWDKLARWAKEDEAGLRLHLALDVCNFFLKTPIPLELFSEESKQYKKLKNRIIQEDMMVSQDGKFARLYTELASDDMSLIWSLISRLWRR